MQPIHPIDEIIESALRLRPDCKPGICTVASKPYIYDANLLRSFECRELVRNADGVDVARLSDQALDTLISASLRRWADTSKRDTAAALLAEQAIAEQRRRSEPCLIRASHKQAA